METRGKYSVLVFEIGALFDSLKGVRFHFASEIYHVVNFDRIFRKIL